VVSLREPLLLCQCRRHAARKDANAIGDFMVPMGSEDRRDLLPSFDYPPASVPQFQSSRLCLQNPFGEFAAHLVGAWPHVRGLSSLTGAIYSIQLSESGLTPHRALRGICRDTELAQFLGELFTPVS
jgi:hypothetical protein